MKKLFLLLFCIFLGACTGLPQTMKNTNVENVTYAQDIQNIEAHNGSSVRWGGVIINVENKDSFSLIQTLFYPLDYSGKPQLDKTSQGRFVIKSTDFFDPMIYVTNRKITVVGTLNGDIERMVGERTIRVPLIQSSAIHLWPKDHFYDYNGYQSAFHDDDYDHGG